MNSDFSDFIRFFPIFRLFPTFRLLDSTTLIFTGMYAYRCSKTALNMVSANLAVELNSEGILVTSFCPG